MEMSEIRKELEQVRRQLEIILQRTGASEHGACGQLESCGGKSSLAGKPALATRQTGEKGELVVPSAGSILRACATIDGNRNDNGFLGCVYARYSATSNTTVMSHFSTAQAFSNLRGCSGDFSIVVGHGAPGMISTGGGQAIDGTDKYMSAGNESYWRPIVTPGVPGFRLVLFGCEVASGAAGADFLKRVANAVRKEVGAWTGLVWCSSSSVWGTGDFVVVKPGGTLSPVEGPVMYEVGKNMDNLKLAVPGGFEDISLNSVKSVNFTPVGDAPGQPVPGTVSGDAAKALLQTIDFANPFFTEDKPASLLFGLLTVTYEDKSKQERVRSFRVLGTLLIEDASFPGTYYYVSKDLPGALKKSK